LDRGADPSIKDNYKGRTPLEVAKYRQFHDVVELLGGGNDKSYLRNPKQIESEGKKKVLQGIHFKNKDLYLGRFLLSEETVTTINHFRKSSSQVDIVAEAEDTVLGISKVFLRHTHNLESHRKEIDWFISKNFRFFRVSTISTNEHILESPKNYWTI